MVCIVLKANSGGSYSIDSLVMLCLQRDVISSEAAVSYS